ncbi:MAG TPA: glycosyltransferase family 87 protein [Stellaceae bacterium]|nr:glycosyltransferase family 87 protein [Stellaceae bacterium]
MPRGLAIAAIVCGVFGLLAWAFDLWLFRVAPLQDWMVFYEAARAYFAGNLPLIFEGNALTAAINQHFAPWLGAPLALHPWVYPPPFLLLILPFGLLPPVASAAVFLLAGFAAVIAIVWCSFDSGYRRWPAIATLLLCPAVPFEVLTGQNAFYTAALMLAAFATASERSLLCGVLVGVLSLKPQLALMAWVALLAGRQWRSIGAAVATGCVLALASAAVLGLDIWRAWFDLVLGGSGVYRSWLDVGRLNGISVFACASWLGAPATLASAVQALATIGAAIAVYWIYRRPDTGGLRLAALLAATILAAPHASNSDAILLGLAASVFVTALPSAGLRPYQLTLAAAVWVSPLFNPPVLFRIGCVTPLLVAGLLAAIVVKMREQARPS